MSEHHDDNRQPFWTVLMIFDPEGTGGDFSYTVGLAERGLPELHMWARPSLGDDPGDDWKFSSYDTCQILNRLAWRLLDNRLHVGDTWREKCDDGLVTADFRVDPPEPAGALEALQAGDGPVLPIRWSIDRAPVGPSLPLNDQALADAVEEYDALYSVFGGFRSVPEGWELVAEPDWSPEGLFGPRTPLVRARAGFVLAADGPAMIGIVSSLLAVCTYSSVSYPATVANTLARPLGRVAAMEEIAHATHRLGDEFAITWGAEAVEELLEWMDMSAPEEREEALHHVRHLLGEALHSFLAVEAVNDACDASLVVHGRGPVMLGYIGNDIPPGPDWVASDSVAAALRALAVERSPLELATAALSWRTEDVESVQGMLMKVEALAATTAAMAPHPNDWIPIEKVDEIQELMQGVGFSIALLQEWGNAFCVLLTHRGLFASEEVAMFTDASAAGVAGLDELLDEPLVVVGQQDRNR